MPGAGRDGDGRSRDDSRDGETTVQRTTVQRTTVQGRHGALLFSDEIPKSTRGARPGPPATLKKPWNPGLTKVSVRRRPRWRRESDVDGEAAAGQGAGRDGGAVGGGDGADDGQAQAVAAVAAGGARADRWKGWNRRSTSAGGMTGPELVTDRTALTALVAGGDLDVPARDVVPDGVVIRLTASCWISSGHRRGWRAGVGADVQAEAADRGPGVARASLVIAARSRGSRWPGGFAAGQGQQRLDEAFLLGVGGQQFPADGLPGAGGGGRVGAG